MRLPGYTQLTVLGEGGFGRVVLARHDASRQVVAIKYLSATDERSRAQFRHEAAVLQRVVSPHVARLYSFHETPAGAAIVMEAVPGVSLKDVLAHYGTLTPEAALVVLKGSLLGLAAAHAAGTVHRDYKPGNVLVQPDNQSKLVDFGIALLSGHSGQTGGTPAYMAPEQWLGGPATPATDVYAATCVFFLCVTGFRPFGDSDTERLRHAHQYTPPPVEHVPPPVRSLVARGMAKDLRHRPTSAAKFVKELEAAATAGYGTNWESAGWQRLAGFAGTLLAASPMAWLISATGVLTAGGTTALAGGAAGATAIGGAAGSTAGTATGSAAAGGAAAGGGAAGAVTGSAAAGSGAAAGSVAVSGGAAAKAAAGALAAKIAAVVIGVAVVVSGTVIVINTVGDPPGAAQEALAVTTRTETEDRATNITVTTETVQVTGSPNASALNDALRAPVTARVDSVVDQVNGIRDRMRADGDDRWDGGVTIDVTAEVLLHNETHVSVRYGNQPLLGELTDSSWQSYDTVTVDLHTGRALTRDDIYLPGAAKALADVLVEDHDAELCPTLSTGDTRVDLTEESLGEAVLVAFTGDHAQFTIEMQRFDRPTACGILTFTLPYNRLPDVLRPELIRDVAAG